MCFPILFYFLDCCEWSIASLANSDNEPAAADSSNLFIGFIQQKHSIYLGLRGIRDLTFLWANI